MGRLLDDELSDNYYVIGTDFYKTKCNLPNGSSGHRTNQVFYSYDPLAKAAMQAKLDICWLDFSYASKSPELSKWISDYEDPFTGGGGLIVSHIRMFIVQMQFTYCRMRRYY